MRAVLAITTGLLVASGAIRADGFPPGWFAGDWVVTGTPEAAACSAGARVKWSNSAKCQGDLYDKGVLNASSTKEDAGKSGCVNPSAGDKFFFPAEKIDENTFVLKGRPFLQTGERHGRQTALAARFFHRCKRR